MGAPPSRPAARGSWPSGLWSAQTASGPSRGRAVLPLLPHYLGARVLLGVPCSGTARLGGASLLPAPGVFPAPVGTPPPAFAKDTSGSPKVPSHPDACMPRSQTPVVSCTLAFSPPGLLPSGHCTPSAFPRCRLRHILWTTTLHISGLYHAAYILVPSS